MYDEQTVPVKNAIYSDGMAWWVDGSYISAHFSAKYCSASFALNCTQIVKLAHELRKFMAGRRATNITLLV